MRSKPTLNRASAYFSSTALVLAVAWTLPTSAMATDFSDGFESDEISELWTVYKSSGTAELTTERVHDGSQALRLRTWNSGNNKGVEVHYNFEAPVYGTVSTWVFDSGADKSSSNYITFFVSGRENRSAAGIGTWDYDLGHGQGGSTYQQCIGKWSDWRDGTVDRTEKWHHWEITCTPQRSELRIDGAIVQQSDTGKPFDIVVLSLHAPYWRPAWMAEFDDLSFVEYQFIAGDLNCDDRVDFNDIDPFVVALTQESDYRDQYPGCDFTRGDIDNDGFVDFNDIDPFVECLINGGCP